MIVTQKKAEFEKHKKLLRIDRERLRKIFKKLPMRPERRDTIDDEIEQFCLTVMLAAMNAQALSRVYGTDTNIKRLKACNRPLYKAIKAFVCLPNEAREALDSALAEKLSWKLIRRGQRAPNQPSFDLISKLLIEIYNAIPEATDRVSSARPTQSEPGAPPKTLEKEIAAAARTAYENLTGKRATRTVDPVTHETKRKGWPGFLAEVYTALGYDLKKKEVSWDNMSKV